MFVHRKTQKDTYYGMKVAFQICFCGINGRWVGQTTYKN